METFSLSRANFHAFALFSICVPARVCFSYNRSVGLLFDLTELWEIWSGFFFSEGGEPERLCDRLSLSSPSPLRQIKLNPFCLRDAHSVDGIM